MGEEFKPTDQYVGKSSTTKLTTYYKDGVWLTEIKIEHAHTTDLEKEWQAKEATTAASGKSLQESWNKAMAEMTSFLESVEFDLFNEPKNKLVLPKESAIQ
jgi:hypothetical protein